MKSSTMPMIRGDGAHERSGCGDAQVRCAALALSSAVFRARLIAGDQHRENRWRPRMTARTGHLECPRQHPVARNGERPTEIRTPRRRGDCAPSRRRIWQFGRDETHARHVDTRRVRNRNAREARRGIYVVARPNANRIREGL